ncbi:unnamed protein product [Moneuplotes crassus]|uniref:Uncharacterized protein n=2 Tax=Euplotes crassus TaxID=5936 RepID=A0AAD1X312_EUPCR|nr:unnamed protein product [Moneuplotes crassus]
MNTLSKKVFQAQKRVLAYKTMPLSPSIWSMRTFCATFGRRDIKVKPIMATKDEELAADLDNYLTNLHSIRDLHKKVRHFTHPKGFMLYRKNQMNASQDSSQELNSRKIRNHIIYNSLVIEKGTPETFGLKSSEMASKLFDSSLKIIKSSNSPLFENDKIHCLYQLSLITQTPKQKSLLKQTAEEVLYETQLNDLNNEAAIDSFLLVTHSGLHLEHKRLYNDILQQMCNKGRIYRIDEIRKAVVILNQAPILLKDEALRYYIPKLFQNNLSPLLPKTDIRTFHQISILLKNYRSVIPKQEHTKLAKVGIKRINRIAQGAERQNNPERDELEDSPFLSLLKMLESYSCIKDFSEAQIERICYQTQKIIETKALDVSFTFLLKVLERLNAFTGYNEASANLYEFLVQSIGESMGDQSFVNSKTLKKLAEFIKILEENQLLEKAFTDPEEKKTQEELENTPEIKEFDKRLQYVISRSLQEASLADLHWFFLQSTYRVDSILIAGKLELLNQKWANSRSINVSCKWFDILEKRKRFLQGQHEITKEIFSEIRQIDRDQKLIIQSTSIAINSKLESTSSGDGKSDLYNLNHWIKILNLDIKPYHNEIETGLMYSLEINLFKTLKRYKTDLELVKLIVKHRDQEGGLKDFYPTLPGLNIDLSIFMKRVKKGKYSPNQKNNLLALIS